MVINETYAYGNWGVVIGMITLALFFMLKYVPMRTKIEKRSGGVLAAFVVALFAEMYGFPLTIYLLTSVLGIDLPLTHVGGHLLGDFLTNVGLGNGWLIVMVSSSILILIGINYIIKGWELVYKAEGGFIKKGIYKKIRHPQYAGIYLVIIGFLIQWPTLITLIMFPFLVIMYYRLAKKEESDMLRKFPNEYKEYIKETAMFFPKLNYS